MLSLTLLSVVLQKLLCLQHVLSQPGQPNSTKITDYYNHSINKIIIIITFYLVTVPVVRLVLSITMPMTRCDLELSEFISENVI